MDKKEIVTYLNNIRTDMDVNRLEEMGYSIWTYETRDKIINHALRNLSGQGVFKQDKNFKFPFENEEWFIKGKKCKTSNV
jgi:hypothetical protein